MKNVYVEASCIVHVFDCVQLFDDIVRAIWNQIYDARKVILDDFVWRKVIMFILKNQMQQYIC